MKSGKKPESLVTRMREMLRGDPKDRCQREFDKSLTSEILTDPLGRLRCYASRTTETAKNSSDARVTLTTLVLGSCSSSAVATDPERFTDARSGY